MKDLLGLPEKDPETQREKVDIMYKVMTNHLLALCLGVFLW